MTDYTKKTRQEAFQILKEAIDAEEWSGKAVEDKGDYTSNASTYLGSTMVAKARQGILGTDSFAVANALLGEIFVSRLMGDAKNLITVCVFAVGLAFTTSAAWAPEYGSLPKPHMLTSFEVSDRKVVKGADGKSDITWVSQSTMNSTAAHILGHMIVSMAPAAGFLGQMKSKIGTMHVGSKGSGERADIMKAAFEGMSAEERAVPSKIAGEAVKLVAIVDAIYGEGVDDLEEMIETVAALAGGAV